MPKASQLTSFIAGGAALAVALLAAATPARGASDLAAQLGVERAGAAYARGDVERALRELQSVMRDQAGCLWAREAVLEASRIVERDFDEADAALASFRRLALDAPRTPQGIIAQGCIAAHYRRSGRLPEACREYARLAKMPLLDVPTRMESAAGEDEVIERGAFRRTPRPRVTVGLANDLIRRAPELAIEAYLATDERTRAGCELPPRCSLARKGEDIIGPIRPIGPISEDEVRYLVAPSGAAFASARVALEAQVHPKMSTPTGGPRGYLMVVEPLCAPGGGAGVVLSGSRNERERLEAELRPAEAVRALRVRVSANGGSVWSWSVKPELAAGPGAPEQAPRGSVRIPTPRTGGCSPALLRTGDKDLLCVYADASPALRASPCAAADLWLSSSSDGGRGWSEPRRLSVSSAADDSSPAIVRFTDGPYLLAWVSDRRGGGFSDLYFSVSADAKTWDRPQMVDLGHPNTMGTSRVVVDSVAAAAESADVVRLAVAVTATDIGADKEERYSASGVYVLTVTRSKTYTPTELVYSTRDKGISRVSGAPAGLGEDAAVSPGVPVDLTRLAPARLAVAWGAAEAGPFISSGEIGGRWTSLYAGITGNLETLVRSRILARPATEGGILMLLARPGTLQCLASSPGRGWGKPVEVAPVARAEIGMPGVVSLGGGRLLAAWGYESELAPSPLWATEFAEPEPPPGR